MRYSDIHYRLDQHSKTLPNGCIVWTGRCNDDGYGEVMYQGKKWKVHRLVAVLYLGFDNDPKVDVRHSCDNPPCRNQEHLIPGTHKENMSDSRQKNRHFLAKQTHCINGHEFNFINTRYTATQKVCRVCDKLRRREKKQRKYA